MVSLSVISSSAVSWLKRILKMGPVVMYEGQDPALTGRYPLAPWAVTFNGTTHHITAAHLVGTETVISSEGTSTPTVSAGRIDFTAGWCAYIVLSDGTIYDLNHGSGTVVYNSVGDVNHGTLVNGPAWAIQLALPPAADVANLEGYWIGDGGDAPVGVIVSPTTFGKSTYTGSVYPTLPEVKGSYAASLDGTDDHINYTALNTELSSNSITVCAWINSSNVNKSFQMIATKSDGGSTNANFELRFSSTTGLLQWYFIDDFGGYNSVVSPDALLNDVWYHVLGRYDGVSLELFINGELVAATASTATRSAAVASNVLVGSRLTGSSLNFQGMVADFRLFNGALTNAEITQAYNGEAVRSDIALINSPLSEGVGDTVLDISGNDNHGTVVNASTGTEGAGFWAGRIDGRANDRNRNNGFSMFSNGLYSKRVPYLTAGGSMSQPPLAIPDDNVFYEVDIADTSGWTKSNASLPDSGGADFTTFTPTSAPTAGTAKLSASLPTTGDWIFYAKIKGSEVVGSVVNFAIGTNTSSDIVASLGYNWATSSYEAGRVSFTAKNGGSYQGKAGANIDHSTAPIDIALQYSELNGKVNFYIKQNGVWEFYGGVATDVPYGQYIKIDSGGGDLSDLDIYEMFIARPNVVSIGDSICAGHNSYDPDPAFYVGDDNRRSSWQHYVRYYSGRNDLIVNYGIGSQSSAIIDSRVASMLTACDPSVVFLHAATNDYGIADAVRTANIQSSIDKIAASGAKVALINSVYPNSDAAVFPAWGDYYKNSWNNHLTSLTGVDVFYDVMSVLGDETGYLNPDYTLSDGVHLSVSGYALAASLISSGGEGWFHVSENPSVSPHPNGCESVEDCKNLTAEGTPTAATNDYPADMEALEFSDFGADMQGSFSPGDTFFRRDKSTTEKDRLITFDHVLTGSELAKAEAYTADP